MRSKFSDGKIYKGFCEGLGSTHSEHKLVLCQDEDILSVFIIDGVDVQEEIDSLLRYFQERQSHCKIIGIYDERGFSGCKVPASAVSAFSRFA